MFRAVDVRKGRVLWQTKLATSVQALPITFAIDWKAVRRRDDRPRRRQTASVPSTLAPEVRVPTTGQVVVRVRAAGQAVGWSRARRAISRRARSGAETRREN